MGDEVVGFVAVSPVSDWLDWLKGNITLSINAIHVFYNGNNISVANNIRRCGQLCYAYPTQALIMC